MKGHQKIWVLAYFLCGVAELLAEGFSLLPLLYLTKPLLMTLLIWLWMTVPDEDTIPFLKGLAVLSLVFSLWGDMFLMIDRGTLFLYGLISFLLCHILYIWMFVILSPWKKKDLFWAIPAYGFAIGMIGLLFPRAGEMAVPSAVYALVISTMLWRALCLLGERPIPKKGLILVLAGVILFVLSDSLIGWNKFVNPVPYARLLIMALYITSQYGIHRGLMELTEKKN